MSVPKNLLLKQQCSSLNTNERLLHLNNTVKNLTVNEIELLKNDNKQLKQIIGG